MGLLSVLEYIFYVFHVLFLYLVQIQGLSIERVFHKSVTHPHLFIRLYPNRSSIVICTWAKAAYCVRRTPKVVIIVGIMPLFIPVSATKSAIRLRMRIFEENKDSLAKSMIFNSIWLKNRLYNSQIELFSFDLAIEYLVDAFLFYPFARSQYEIKAFGDSRGDKELSCL